MVDSAHFIPANSCYESGVNYCVAPETLKRAVIEHGPILVVGYFDTQALSSYGGEPDTGAYNAGKPFERGNEYSHFYLLYGWNDTCTAFTPTPEDSIPVWLAKNSWGSGWGEPGNDQKGGEDSGCFKLDQDHDNLRLGAVWVDWTPLAKPDVKGPWSHSAFIADTVAPTDTTVRLVWGIPTGAAADSVHFLLNIVQEGELTHSEIQTDTVFDLHHAEVGSTFGWYVRAFAEGRQTEKVSDWAGSDEVMVQEQPCCTVRGDFDHSGYVQLLDYVYLVCYQFYGGFYPRCWEEADVNNDNSVDVSDIIYLASYLLQSGPPPPACD